MVMDIIQVRMSKGLIKKLDSMVNTGLCSNRSDAIRDAVRRINWAKEVGTVPSKGSAVRQVRKARAELSKKQ